MQWPGQSAFNNATITNWYVNGKLAGQAHSAQGFTFTTIENSGHMVVSYSSSIIVTSLSANEPTCNCL
jgi:carboxypeptidase C (cathepsin A)